MISKKEYEGMKETIEILQNPEMMKQILESEENRKKRIKFKKGKVPQIGWNKIIPEKKSIFKDDYMYFVNSYYAIPKDNSIIAAITDYNDNFVSAIQSNNITAMQFHPEKSGKAGIELIKRWLSC